MIRGDEGYSNTTDTILSVTGDIDDSSVSYFTCPFKVEVFRDLDATDGSFVEIYDGDEVVLTIPWNSNVHQYTFELNLSYGIEHSIRARYSGNRLCLRSYSKTLTFDEPIPDRNVGQLDLYQFNSYWDTDTANDIVARFRTVGESQTGIANKNINLYIDDEYVGSGTTGSNGRVTFANIKPADLSDDDVDDRVYSVMVEFNGDDYYAPTTFTTSMSVGFNIRVDKKDDALINNEQLSVTATMLDQRGRISQAISGANGATLSLQAYVDGSWVRLSPETQLTEGKSTMLVSLAKMSECTVDGTLTWRARAIYHSKNYFTTETYVTKVYTPTSMVFETTKPIIGVGQISTLGGSVGGVPKGVRVNLTGDVNETVTTITNGRFEMIYDGEGDGAKSVTATCGDISQTITFRDVVQYWDAVLGSINKNYTVLSNYVLELSNGFKFSPQTTKGYSELGLGNGTPLTFDSWMLSCKVVNSTSHFDFVVGSWKLDEGNRVTDTHNISNLTLTQGQVITIVCANEKISVLVDGDEIATNINYLEGGSPIIGIKDEDKNHYLTINNLEFIRSTDII